MLTKYAFTVHQSGCQKRSKHKYTPVHTHTHAQMHARAHTHMYTHFQFSNTLQWSIVPLKRPGLINAWIKMKQICYLTWEVVCSSFIPLVRNCSHTSGRMLWTSLSHSQCKRPGYIINELEVCGNASVINQGSNVFTFHCNKLPVKRKHFFPLTILNTKQNIR